MRTERNAQPRAKDNEQTTESMADSSSAAFVGDGGKGGGAPFNRTADSSRGSEDVTVHSKINSWITLLFLAVVFAVLSSLLSKLTATFPWLRSLPLSSAGFATLSGVIGVSAALIATFKLGRFLAEIIPVGQPLSGILMTRGAPELNTNGERFLVTVVLVALALLFQVAGLVAESYIPRLSSLGDSSVETESASVSDPYGQMETLYSNSQFAQLLTLAEAHLAQNPNDANALNFAGLALVSLGNKDAGRLLYQRAVKLNPNDPVLYYNLASTYDPYADYQKIVKILKTGQKIDPNNKLINESLSGIQAYAQKMGTEPRQEPNRSVGIGQNTVPPLSRHNAPRVGSKPGYGDSETTANPARIATKRYGDFVSTAAYGTVEEVKEAIDNGAYINGSNGQSTALISATRYNRPEIVRLLLSAGADVEVADKNGRTAIVHAKVNANSEIIEMLRSYGATDPFAK
jgi:tetratricopeptide (TPR) repeat protein